MLRKIADNCDGSTIVKGGKKNIEIKALIKTDVCRDLFSFQHLSFEKVGKFDFCPKDFSDV